MIGYREEEMTIFSANDKIAVAPFPDQSIQTGAEGAGQVKVGVVKSKNTLAALRVVFPNTKLTGAATVWVAAENFQQPWARKIHELYGEKFIMMPISYVELVEYE